MQVKQQTSGHNNIPVLGVHGLNYNMPLSICIQILFHSGYQQCISPSMSKAIPTSVAVVLFPVLSLFIFVDIYISPAFVFAGEKLPPLVLLVKKNLLEDLSGGKEHQILPGR